MKRTKELFTEPYLNYNQTRGISSLVNFQGEDLTFESREKLKQ
jgi:hypothetical protein